MRAVSFDSDHSGGDGASPFFLLRSVFYFPPSTLLVAALCGRSGSGKDCFLATLLISGVAGHVPVRSSLQGPLRLHGGWAFGD
jgi:hypothetical protein